jgi:hypothetical protein
LIINNNNTDEGYVYFKKELGGHEGLVKTKMGHCVKKLGIRSYEISLTALPRQIAA